MGEYDGTWGDRIAECRGRIGDDSPFLAVTWWEPDTDFEYPDGNTNMKKPPDRELYEWAAGEDDHALKEFLRRPVDEYGSGLAPFVAWTETFVYFTVVSDAWAWVNAVPAAPMLGYYANHSGGW